jgi:hypothetical protein
MRRSMRICVARILAQKNDQDNRITNRIFLGPTDDEFFRIVIQILFVKWGWIQRVEELTDFLQVDFDAVRV